MKYDRHNEILSILRSKGSLSISELCDLVYASPATLRRDLTYLESKGYCKRFPGGASIIEQPYEMPFDLRSELNTAEKKYLANLALPFIKDGQLLFFDSSTTCIRFGQHLEKFDNIEIVTNGSASINILSQYPNLTVYSTGGRVNPKTLSMLGSDAHQFIGYYFADIFFLSCRGLTELGAYESSNEEAEIKRFFAKHAKMTILLCDSSKFNENYHHLSLGLENIDYIISDKPIPINIKKAISQKNVPTINIYEK